jgi:hypothetical protein
MPVAGVRIIKHKIRPPFFYLHFLLGLVFISFLMLAGSRLPNSRIRVIDRNNIYGGRTISISYRGDPTHGDKCLYINDLFDLKKKIKETRIFLTEPYSRRTGCYKIINYYNLPYSGGSTSRVEHFYRPEFAARKGYSRRVNYLDPGTNLVSTDLYNSDGKMIRRVIGAGDAN